MLIRINSFKVDDVDACDGCAEADGVGVFLNNFHADS